MPNRIRRGFNRIGIGAAVLVAIAGIRVTGIVAKGEYWQQVYLPPKQTIAVDPNKSWLDTAPKWTPPVWQPAPEAVVKAAAIGLGITAMLYAVTWAFFAGLGWVIDGLGRDP